MLPKFSMALSRRTITPLLAITCAPLARLMLIMAGSNSGAMPTARAMAKSKDSISGRCKSTLMAKAATTSTNITLVIR